MLYIKWHLAFSNDDSGYSQPAHGRVLEHHRNEIHTGRRSAVQPTPMSWTSTHRRSSLAGMYDFGMGLPDSWFRERFWLQPINRLAQSRDSKSRGAVPLQRICTTRYVRESRCHQIRDGPATEDLELWRRSPCISANELHFGQGTPSRCKINAASARSTQRCKVDAEVQG
jgi:hypothetical protein